MIDRPLRIFDRGFSQLTAIQHYFKGTENVGKAKPTEQFVGTPKIPSDYRHSPAPASKNPEAAAIAAALFPCWQSLLSIALASLLPLSPSVPPSIRRGPQGTIQNMFFPDLVNLGGVLSS